MANLPVFHYDHVEIKRKGKHAQMTFGEKLSLLRKENNYTQEQLAELLQVSRQSISKWESGLAYPETDRLIKIGKLFSCSMDYLLNDETTQRQPGPDHPEPSEASGFTITIRQGNSIRHVSIKEKKSEKTILGMPLYHIGRNAHGFFALGLKAKGVFSLGLFSTGIFSFGVLSMGLFALGALALGGIALGAIALGILAIGAICLGIISIGALSIGCFSWGALAIGKYLAIGDEARSLIAIGKTNASGTLYSHLGALTAQEAQSIRQLLSSHVPGWLSWAIKLVQGWLPL